MAKINSLIETWISEMGPAKIQDEEGKEKEVSYELSRSEFLKEGTGWFLRVYIDRLFEGNYEYVSSDDCERVSRYLSAKLDEEDPIKQNYVLEVSSPGMDRPLLSEKDYQRFKGELIDIKLYKPMEGIKTKEFQAKLVDYKDGVFTLEDEKGNQLQLAKDLAAKLSLAVVF